MTPIPVQQQAKVVVQVQATVKAGIKMSIIIIRRIIRWLAY